MLKYYWALLKEYKGYSYSLYFRPMLYHKLCQNLNLNLHAFHGEDIIVIATLAYSLFPCTVYIDALEYKYIAFKI